MVYIGQRGLQIRLGEATREVYEQYPKGSPPKSAIESAAIKYGVTTQEIEQQLYGSTEWYKEPEQYVSTTQLYETKIHGKVVRGTEEFVGEKIKEAQEFQKKHTEATPVGGVTTMKPRSYYESMIAPLYAGTVEKDEDVMTPRESTKAFYSGEEFQIYGQRYHPVPQKEPTPLTIESARPQTITEAVTYGAARAQEQARVASIRGELPSTMAYTAAAFSLGAVEVALFAATQPKQFAVETVKMVRHPWQSVQMMGTALSEQPARTLGQFYTTGKIFKTTYKATKYVLPSYEVIKLPMKTGKQTVYRGLTYGDKRVFGIEYEFAVDDLAIDRYVPETKLETRYALEIAKEKYSPLEAKKPELAIKLMKKTEKVKSKYTRDKFTREIKSLPKEGVQEVIKFSKKERALTYGSFTAEAQLPKGALERGRGVPKGEPAVADIDVQLNVGGELAEIKAQQLLTNLKRLGIKARISKEKPLLIETRGKDKQWHHAVDIHSIDEPLDINIPTEGAYGFKFGQPPIYIEKAKAMRLSEFGLRKGAASLIMREKGFAPEPHRMKDIPDFITSQEYLLKSKGIKEYPTLTELKEIYIREGSITPRAQPRVSVPLYEPKTTRKGIVSIAPSKTSARARSISPSMRPSSMKPSASPISKSVSVSKSPYISPSKSLKVFISPSPYTSPSRPISPSASIPTSASPSPSPYPSVSPSVYVSESPYTTTTPPPPPPPRIRIPFDSQFKEFPKTDFGERFKPLYGYAPDVPSIAQMIIKKGKPIMRKYSPIEGRPIYIEKNKRRRKII